MPASINPIFNRKVLKNALDRIILSNIPAIEQKQQILAKWQHMILSQKLKDAGEVALHGVFLNDLFATVLGYAQITEHPTEWNLVQEQKTQFDATKTENPGSFSATADRANRSGN